MESARFSEYTGSEARSGFAERQVGGLVNKFGALRPLDRRLFDVELFCLTVSLPPGRSLNIASRVSDAGICHVCRNCRCCGVEWPDSRVRALV